MKPAYSRFVSMRPKLCGFSFSSVLVRNPRRVTLSSTCSLVKRPFANSSNARATTRRALDRRSGPCGPTSVRSDGRVAARRSSDLVRARLAFPARVRSARTSFAATTSQTGRRAKSCRRKERALQRLCSEGPGHGRRCGPAPYFGACFFSLMVSRRFGQPVLFEPMISSESWPPAPLNRPIPPTTAIGPDSG